MLFHDYFMMNGFFKEWGVDDTYYFYKEYWDFYFECWRTIFLFFLSIRNVHLVPIENVAFS